MIYLPMTPPPPLGELVEVMFYLRDYEPEHAVERLVPDGSINLIIELDGQLRSVFDNESMQVLRQYRGAWVSGAHRAYISISALKGSELLAVRFKAGGAYPLFKRALDSLCDKVVDADLIFGAAIDELRDELLGLPDGPTKLQRLASWLDAAADYTMMADPRILKAVEEIIADPTQVTLKRIIEASGVSQKHFIHLFKRYIGMAPKHYQRILRFARVIPLIHAQEEINWAQLGQDCGYFDQAHFIKDFREFSGFNPQKFFKQGHDRQNFFPLE